MLRLAFFITIFFYTLSLSAAERLLLKENFRQAQPGDYVVIAQGKSYTLFHIFDRKDSQVTVEEVTIPSTRNEQEISSWKGWLESGAPGNTSWVHYWIDLDSGEMTHYYSYTKCGFYIVPEAENFLYTLLHLPLAQLPANERRKIGPPPRSDEPDRRTTWQPQMVYEGKNIEGVSFDVFTARWPSDGGPISGKNIEIYLPHDQGRYPAYFPYWLQVRGTLGQAKVRIIDSGKGLISPKQKKQVINNPSFDYGAKNP